MSGSAEERTLLEIKPHPLSIVLRRALVLGVLAASPLAWALAGRVAPVPVPAGVWAWGLWACVVVLAWEVLVWWSRTYRLTDRRIERRSGVLRRSIAELPLRNVQHVLMYRSIRERVFGLGTLGFATAGTGGVEVLWVMIGRPAERLAEVRRAMESAR